MFERDKSAIAESPFPYGNLSRQNVRVNVNLQHLIRVFEREIEDYIFAGLVRFKFNRAADSREFARA